MGDVLPHSLEAEVSVLGSMMLSRTATDAMVEQLTTSDFYRTAHGLLFDLIRRTAEDGPVDAVTVIDRAVSDGLLDQLGGASSIHDLTSAVPTAANVTHYANIVRRLARLRRVAEKGQHVAREAIRGQADPGDLVTEFNRDLETVDVGHLPLYVGADILRVPEPEWLVEGHIAEGLAMIVGPYGSGKSMVTIDAALSVANGVPWWGADVSRRRVLYVAAEGVSGVAQRMEAWVADRHGTSLDAVALFGQPLNLHRPSDAARLDALVRQHQASLLVLDTWARMTAGEDENDNGKASAAVEVLDRLKARRGCDIWVVHHTGSSGDKPRGATALPGAADTGVRIDRQAKVVEVSCFKQKDAPEFDRQRFVIVPHGKGAVLHRKVDAGGQSRSSTDLDRADALTRVRAAPEPRSSLEAAFGLRVVDELVQHPEVVEGRDERGRRVLAHVDNSSGVSPLTAI